MKLTTVCDVTLIARFLWELAVKKAHGVPIAKLKLIKNRGQIMPPYFFNEI
jgi:hypothetical protein